MSLNDNLPNADGNQPKNNTIDNIQEDKRKFTEDKPLASTNNSTSAVKETTEEITELLPIQTDNLNDKTEIDVRTNSTTNKQDVEKVIAIKPKDIALTDHALPTSVKGITSSVLDNTDEITEPPKNISNNNQDTPDIVPENNNTPIHNKIDELEDNSDNLAIDQKDYKSMSMEELVLELQRLLNSQKIQNISKHANVIKSEFNTKFSALIEKKKEEFVAEGGNEIDFYYTNNTKKTFNDLFRTYKKEINLYYNQREAELKQNLKHRLNIIEQIKGLLSVEENINTAYKQFKSLQEQWRNAGPIPRDRYNNAWNSYHHHVELFYDFLHLNNDLRDMDFKYNYEQKLKIIAQAEALVQKEDVNKAFHELQMLHRIWKEELGPVAKEYRETIWERFSELTKIIHDKRQAYFEDLDKSYEKNLKRKEELIVQIQNIAIDTKNTHSAWQKKIKDIEALREAFFNAGKVPSKSTEATWRAFKDSLRTFNKNKNAFYKSLKKDQFENLQKKKDLIKTAEDNKDSNDFDTVTPLMKKIQNEWKKIGHVPRKDGDVIWNQFKDACNHYFDRLHNKRKAEDQPLYEAFDKKTEMLKDFKSLSLGEDLKDNVKLLKQKVSEWKAIGHVPHNKRYIDGKFYKLIDDAFTTLKLDKEKLELVKFENKLETIVANNDTRTLDAEQNFIRKKISDINSEINQLENNLQFFSNIKDDNPLIKDVHKNIAKHRDELNLWKVKLSKIRELYKT